MTMKLKGSYTVEAAFVFPIVLGVIFVLLYVLFWVHDQCVLQANAQNALMKYSERQDKLPTDEEWKHILQKNLWLGNVEDVSISHKGTTWRGKATLSSAWQNGLTALFFDDKQKAEYHMEWEERQPSDVLRFRQRDRKQE